MREKQEKKFCYINFHARAFSGSVDLWTWHGMWSKFYFSSIDLVVVCVKFGCKVFLRWEKQLLRLCWFWFHFSLSLSVQSQIASSKYFVVLLQFNHLASHQIPLFHIKFHFKHQELTQINELIQVITINYSISCHNMSQATKTFPRSGHSTYSTDSHSFIIHPRANHRRRFLFSYRAAKRIWNSN